MNGSPSVRVLVWGPWACFTRPEMKVERVSYPVMTPSAARGVLEAILWKPQFRWVIQQIVVLKPIRFQGIRRNEIQSKISPRAVSRWMAEPEYFEPLWADFMGEGAGGERSERTPRNTLALREVAYVIEARVTLTTKAQRPGRQRLNEDEPDGRDSEMKYVSMFNRRVERGQYWQRPYLGCREFAADFQMPTGQEQPIEDSREVGLMLYDIQYDAVQGHRALFFEARVDRGVLRCEPERVLPDSEERRDLSSC